MVDPFDAGIQMRAWDRLYGENRRPWRGVGRIGLEINPGEKALDVGCGNGKTVLALLSQGASVTGVDFSANAIARCRESIGEKAEFVLSDCTSLPFGDGSFGLVTMVHVLEHLDGERLVAAVSEAERVTVPGGRIFVRSFSEGDMRSGGSRSDVRGNGIAYAYRSPEEITALFTGSSVLSAILTEDDMRFGGTRVRAECLFRRNGEKAY